MAKAQTEEERKQEAAELWKVRGPFYSTVGQAISMWADMEGTLVQVAARLIATSERKAGLILYSIMNFYTWLAIIDELFSLEPKLSELKTQWGAISADLRSLNDIRVRLAHHTVWGYPNDPLALRPGKFDARAKSRKHQPMTAKEIFGFTKNVGAVDDHLIKLIADMEKVLKEPLSSFAETLLGLNSDPQSQDGSQPRPTPTKP